MSLNALEIMNNEASITELNRALNVLENYHVHQKFNTLECAIGDVKAKIAQIEFENKKLKGELLVCPSCNSWYIEFSVVFSMIRSWTQLRCGESPHRANCRTTRIFEKLNTPIEFVCLTCGHIWGGKGPVDQWLQE